MGVSSLQLACLIFRICVVAHPPPSSPSFSPAVWLPYHTPLESTLIPVQTREKKLALTQHAGAYYIENQRLYKNPQFEGNIIFRAPSSLDM